jgi:hypothetical protein
MFDAVLNRLLSNDQLDRLIVDLRINPLSKRERRRLEGDAGV